MNDICTEQLIKRKKSKRSVVSGRNGACSDFTECIWCRTLSIFYVLQSLLFVVVDYLVSGTWMLEYEYLYVNGEFDVDKIMSEARTEDGYLT